MLINSETVILKQSRSFGSLGGDIIRSEEDLNGLEKTRFNVTSEDAFFNNIIYKAYYIKNTSKRKIKNIDLTVSGGMRDPLSNAITPTNDFQLRQSLDNRAIVRYQYPGIEDEFYQRYLNGQQPYIPTAEEMTLLMSGGLTEKEAFIIWLNNNMFLSGYTRSSVFNQIKASILMSTRRVLSTFSDSGVGKSIDLTTLSFKDGSIRVRLPVDLEPGEYWGFYLKLETQFVPSNELKKDMSILQISWQEQDNTMHISQPVRFLFETEFTSMLELQNESLEKLYQNYPPFFMYYMDGEV